MNLTFSEINSMENFHRENGNDDNEKMQRKGTVKEQNAKFTRKQNIILYVGLLLIYLFLFLIYYFFLKDIFPKPYFPPVDDF